MRPLQTPRWKDSTEVVWYSNLSAISAPWFHFSPLGLVLLSLNVWERILLGKGGVVVSFYMISTIRGEWGRGGGTPISSGFLWKTTPLTIFLSWFILYILYLGQNLPVYPVFCEKEILYLSCILEITGLTSSQPPSVMSHHHNHHLSPHIIALSSSAAENSTHAPPPPCLRPPVVPYSWRWQTLQVNAKENFQDTPCQSSQETIPSLWCFPDVEEVFIRSLGTWRARPINNTA